MGVKALAEGILLLHGEVRGRFKEIKELFPDEWSAGAYHRAPALPMPLAVIRALPSGVRHPR